MMELLFAHLNGFLFSGALIVSSLALASSWETVAHANKERQMYNETPRVLEPPAYVVRSFEEAKSPFPGSYTEEISGSGLDDVWYRRWTRVRIDRRDVEGRTHTLWAYIAVDYMAPF